MNKVFKIDPHALGKLPSEAFALLRMGEYSLYKVSVSGNPEVVFALRTGPTSVIYLDKEGAAVQVTSKNISVEGQVLFLDESTSPLAALRFTQP